jgi:glycosyltransferase involved in cell wall biosynthesis
LRIAQIAPPFYEVPPQGYGGTERVCAALVDGLVAVGHDVLLIAAGPHRTHAQHFASTFTAVQREGTTTQAAVEALHAERADALLAEYDPDIVHDHTRVGLASAGGRKSPTVATVHTAVTGSDSETDMYRAFGHVAHLVAVSDAQRRAAPDLMWIATVHNGVAVNDYLLRTRPQKDSFALYLGRVSWNKGVDLAIDAAHAAGVEIVIAGSWTIPSERDYFDSTIRPRLGPAVEWVGEVSGDTRLDLLSRAGCLLFPSRWAEPFGLAMVEAMASGTPVVALRAGSVEEVVAHGVTGVVCEDASELADAIRVAMTLDPSVCRAQAATRFSMDRMTAAYQRVYQSLA